MNSRFKHLPRDCIGLIFQELPPFEQWIVSRYYEPFASFSEFAKEPGEGVAATMAVWRRSISLLEWLYLSSRLTTHFDRWEAIGLAHRIGYLEGLKWFHSKGILIPSPIAAASNGHLDVLQWLFDVIPGLNSSVSQGTLDGIVFAAAYSGHLHVTRWLFEARIHSGSNITNASIHSKNLELVRYLFEVGYTLIGDVCGYAASISAFDILVYLRSKGFPWGKTAEGASATGSKEMLKWCITNGCPYDREICARAKNKDMHEWIVDNDYCRCHGLYHIGLERFSFYTHTTHPSGVSYGGE